MPAQGALTYLPFSIRMDFFSMLPQKQYQTKDVEVAIFPPTQLPLFILQN